jgi:hypothetical protein
MPSKEATQVIDTPIFLGQALKEPAISIAMIMKMF